MFCAFTHVLRRALPPLSSLYGGIFPEARLPVVLAHDLTVGMCLRIVLQLRIGTEEQGDSVTHTDL